jgi:hypothetical protein
MPRKTAPADSASRARPSTDAAIITRLNHIKKLAHDLGLEDGPATLEITNEIIAAADAVRRLLKA